MPVTGTVLDIALGTTLDIALDTTLDIALDTTLGTTLDIAPRIAGQILPTEGTHEQILSNR